MISLSDVLAADGGQAYITMQLPDAAESFAATNRKFRIRDEKTPSANLFRHKKDGHWMVKDFGSGDPAMNAVGLKMWLDKVDFIEALHNAAAFYQLTDTSKSLEIRADYNARPATPDEQPGQISYELKELEMHEIRTILAEKAWEALGRNDDERLAQAITMCQFYHLKAVKSYSSVSQDGKKVNIFSANERFPIFLFDEGSWQKLYKPKDEKQYRFQSIGKKPENFIHGLEQHSKKIAELNEAAMVEYNEAQARGEKAALKEELYPELIICTGGSDALNVAALGFSVVWLNSETADLRYDDYRALDKLCTNLYNLPDIDLTGVAEARKLAHKYLAIRTIWLPAHLAKQKDWRGNAMKDVRDYLRNHRKRDFKGLVEVAYPFQFWDEEIMYNKGGMPKKKFGRWQLSYQFNNVYGYNFLNHNGFFRMESEKEKEGYFFVRIENNIVRKIEANDMKNYLHAFLETYVQPDGKRINEDLRNTIYRSPQLSEASLSNLRATDPDFRYYGPDFQYFFFADETWKITPSSVEKVKTPDVSVWEKKVYAIETRNRATGERKQHKTRIVEPMFRIEKQADGWDINIHNTESDALKFLIQTCKLHWREETETRFDFWKLAKGAQLDYVELHALTPEEHARLLTFQNAEVQAEYRKKYQFRLDGELLLPEEVAEQKLALVNRLFVMGYMLHRYKRSETPWAGFAMDYRISDEGQSNGGAGKGLVAKMLYKCLTSLSLDGRNENLMANPHVFENVEKDTDLIHLEDMSEFFPFKSLFTPLTSSLTSNPKNRRAVTLNYEEYGKFWIDTNFGDRATDQSSKRRKIYTVFADYYHEDLDHYREVRTPKTELGKSMFDDWDETQWVLFYNLMAQALAFYLSVEEKIEPPTANLNKRNLMSTMGDNFRAWADVYFAPESNRLDDYVQKKPAMDDFISESKLKITPQGFTAKMKAWCRYNRYEYNPAEILAGKDRIIHTVQVTDRDGTKRNTTAEMMYLHTNSPKKEAMKAPEMFPTQTNIMPF